MQFAIEIKSELANLFLKARELLLSFESMVETPLPYVNYVQL